MLAPVAPLVGAVAVDVVGAVAGAELPLASKVDLVGEAGLLTSGSAGNGTVAFAVAPVAAAAVVVESDMEKADPCFGEKFNTDAKIQS